MDSVDLEKKEEKNWFRVNLEESEPRDNPIRSDDDGPSTFRANTRSRRGAKKLRKLRVQQRHILCHWSRFDKKDSSFRREETVRNVCAWTSGERRKEERNEGEKREQKKKRMIRRWSNRQRERKKETVQKRARIMNILKSHKALSAGFHSRRFFNPCTSGTNVNLPRCFLYLIRFLPVSHASFSRERPSSPRVSFPLPLSLFRGSYHQPSCLCRLRADQSMRDFCVGTTDWGAALPSMGTKTCCQHCKQEITNYPYLYTIPNAVPLPTFGFLDSTAPAYLTFVGK